MNDGQGSVDHIAGGKDTGTGGHVVFVDNQETAFVGVQADRGIDQFVLGPLIDRDNRGIGPDQFILAGDPGGPALFIENGVWQVQNSRCESKLKKGRSE